MLGAVGVALLALLAPPRTTSVTKRCNDARMCTAANSVALVWLTGAGDLRVHDHPGLAEAAECAERVVPAFVLDDEIHLRCAAPASIRRLHTALTALESRLSASGLPLLVVTGDATKALPQLCTELQAVSCHVIEDDVVQTIRDVQHKTCAQLHAQGVTVARWSNALRKVPDTFPRSFDEYSSLAASLAREPLREAAARAGSSASVDTPATSLAEPIPTLEAMLARAQELTPPAVAAARRHVSTEGAPYPPPTHPSLFLSPF